ncbi:MAG: FtsL-like putative cell division protein [Flavobacteriaceae bacterium]|nr:FtsL-like putative cell division protein [Flavobacteriaceae bacterium]
MNQLLSLLNMDFLTKDDALKNWRMILYLSLLALIIISSGHLADKKIFEIAQLNNELKEMKSEFVEKRAYLMELKMESRVIKSLREIGIKPSKIPPVKLTVESDKK